MRLWFPSEPIRPSSPCVQEFIEVHAEHVGRLEVKAYMQVPTLLILDGPWDVVHTVEFDAATTPAAILAELAAWGL